MASGPWLRRLRRHARHLLGRGFDREGEEGPALVDSKSVTPFVNPVRCRQNGKAIVVTFQKVQFADAMAVATTIQMLVCR